MVKNIGSCLSILLCVLMSGVLGGCSKDDDVAPELMVPTKQFEVSSNGGNINVPLTTNQEIEVLVPTEVQSWIQARTVTSNNVVSGISLSVSKSEEYETRSAEIVIKGGPLTETVKISQTGSQILTLDKKEGHPTFRVIRQS